MDMLENNGDTGEMLPRDDQRWIEELLARGDFAKFPPHPAVARSLTCSRLVDENNLLKPLPKELIGEPVSAMEELVSAHEVVEGMDIQTSEATLLPSSSMEDASCPSVQQPRPRKRREERKSELISQGGRQALPGSVRRWCGSSLQSSKKVVVVSGKAQPTMMRNRNSGGKSRQLSPQRTAGNSLVILNKSSTGKPLVLQVLGEDDQLKEKQILKPGVKLVVEGEMVVARTPRRRGPEVKKLTPRQNRGKEAGKGVVLQYNRAAWRPASITQPQPDKSGESPAGERPAGGMSTGSKEGEVEMCPMEDEEVEGEVVEPTVGLIQAELDAPHGGEDLVDEMCLTEVEASGHKTDGAEKVARRVGENILVNDEFNVDERADEPKVEPAVSSKQAQLDHHHGEDLWEEMCTEDAEVGDEGGEGTGRRNIEETKEKGVDKEQDSTGADTVVNDSKVEKSSKGRKSGSRSVQAGRRGASGACALPRPRGRSGIWGKSGSWVYEKDSSEESVEVEERCGRGYSGQRVRAQSCSTPLCFRSVKCNDLGEVTRLCDRCIDEQLMMYNKFKTRGDEVEGANPRERKIILPVKVKDQSGFGGALVEENSVRPSTSGMMQPPSCGVKRKDRVRRGRESAIRALSSVSRSLTSSRAGARVSVCKVSNLVERNLKISEASISPSLTYMQLRQECNRRGLHQGGSKAKLLARLGWKEDS